MSFRRRVEDINSSLYRKNFLTRIQIFNDLKGVQSYHEQCMVQTRPNSNSMYKNNDACRYGWFDLKPLILDRLKPERLTSNQMTFKLIQEKTSGRPIKKNLASLTCGNRINTRQNGDMIVWLILSVNEISALNHSSQDKNCVRGYNLIYLKLAPTCIFCFLYCKIIFVPLHQKNYNLHMPNQRRRLAMQ